MIHRCRWWLAPLALALLFAATTYAAHFATVIRNLEYFVDEGRLFAHARLDYNTALFYFHQATSVGERQAVVRSNPNELSEQDIARLFDEDWDAMRYYLDHCRSKIRNGLERAESIVLSDAAQKRAQELGFAFSNSHDLYNAIADRLEDLIGQTKNEHDQESLQKINAISGEISQIWLLLSAA